MRTIVVDIDGILTKETEGFGEDIYLRRTPNKWAIETLRDYKRRGFKIILYSARHLEDREVTEKWLKMHNVPYDELILGKPHGVRYVDDLATNILEREVLCVSGGLDSTIAYFYLHYPQPLYVKLNHRYQRKELHCLKKLKKVIESEVEVGFPIKIVNGPDLSQFEYGETAYIPRRNLLLALIASYYGNKIYIIGVRGDKVEDKSPEAYEVMSFTMNFISKKNFDPSVKIESPFWEMTKVDILKWFLSNYDKEFVKEVIYTSVSCYDPNTLRQCGKCPACFRKAIALENVGIFDPSLFEEDIRKWEGIKEYAERVKMGYYDSKRSEEIKIALKRWGWW